MKYGEITALCKERSVSMKDGRTKKLLIERLLEAQKPVEKMVGYHRGVVEYALPVIIIKKIMSLAWHASLAEGVSSSRARKKPKRYSWPLTLDLVSKEMFDYVSKHLFVDITFETVMHHNMVSVVRRFFKGLYLERLVNPYCPLKSISRLMLTYLAPPLFPKSTPSFHIDALFANVTRLDTCVLTNQIITPMTRLEHLTIVAFGTGFSYNLLLERPITTLILPNYAYASQYISIPFLDYLEKQTSLTSVNVSKHNHIDIGKTFNKPNLTDLTIMVVPSVGVDPAPFIVPNNIKTLKFEGNATNLNKESLNTLLSTNRTLEHLSFNLATIRDLNLTSWATTPSTKPTASKVHLILQHFEEVPYRPISTPPTIASTDALTRAITSSSIPRITISLADSICAHATSNILKSWTQSSTKHTYTQRQEQYRLKEATAIKPKKYVPPPPPAVRVYPLLEGKDFTYIQELEHNHTDWKIRGLVRSKSEIVTWDKRIGEGKVFTIELIDDSPEINEIRATIFNDFIGFNEILTVGKTYLISGGSVKAKNSQYNDLRHPCEISFTSETKVCESQALDVHTHYSPTPIGSFKDMVIKENSIFDVIGKIDRIDGITIVKDDKLKRLTINIHDESDHSIDVTFWDNQAQQYSDTLRVGNIVAFKYIKLSSFNTRTLNFRSGSFLEINPSHLPQIDSPISCFREYRCYDGYY
eukprot:gene12775-14988_t